MKFVLWKISWDNNWNRFLLMVNVQLAVYMSAKRMLTFLSFLCIFGVRKNARLKEKFSLIFPFLLHCALMKLSRENNKKLK